MTEEQAVESAQEQVQQDVDAQNALAQKVFDLARENNQEEILINIAIFIISEVDKLLNSEKKLSSEHIKSIKLLLSGFSVLHKDEIKSKLVELENIISTILKIKSPEEYKEKITKMQDLCVELKQELSALHDEVIESGVDGIKNALPQIVEAINRIEQSSVSNVALLYTAFFNETLKQNMKEYIEKITENLDSYIKRPLEKINTIKFDEAINNRPKVIIELPKGMFYGNQKFTKIIFAEPKVSDLIHNKEHSVLESLASKYDGINLTREAQTNILLHREAFWQFIKNTTLLFDENGSRLNAAEVTDWDLDVFNFFLHILLMFLKKSSFLKLKEEYQLMKHLKDESKAQIGKIGLE